MANQRKQSKNAHDFRARRLARAAAKGKAASAALPTAKLKGKASKSKNRTGLKPGAPAPTAKTAAEAKLAAQAPQLPVPPSPGTPSMLHAQAPAHVGHGTHAKDGPHAAPGKNVDAAFDDRSPEHLTPPDSPAKRHWFGHKDDGKKGDKPDKG